MSRLLVAFVLLVAPSLAQLGRFHLDLLAEFTSETLFEEPDQRFWRFNRLLCDGFSGYPGASCRPASTLNPALVQPSTMQAAVYLRPFASGEHVLPYSNGMFLYTLVINGTVSHVLTMASLLNENQTHRQSLGIVSAHVVPDINAIYRGAGLSLGRSDTQLSITWHIILVLGTLLAVALVYVLATRSYGKPGSRSEKGDTVTKDTGADENVNEAITKQRDFINDAIAHDCNPQWAESDLPSKQRNMQELERSRCLTAERQRAQGDTSGGDAWSVDVLKEALAVDPRFNLPPQGGLNFDTIIPSSKRKKAESAKAEEEQRKEGKEKAEKAAASLAIDDDDFELPPEADTPEETDSKNAEDDKKVKAAVPMGLAARRMAAMMTALAATGHSSLGGSDRRAAFTLTRGGSSPLAAKRQMRQEQQEPTARMEQILSAPLMEAQENPVEQPGVLNVPMPPPKPVARAAFTAEDL